MPIRTSSSTTGTCRTRWSVIVRARSCTLMFGEQVCTCAVMTLDTGSASSPAPRVVQPAGDVPLGDDAVDAATVGGHDERTDALVGEHAERGAHALRAVDGGDLAALVAEQLADLHRNLLTDPCAERCGECAPAAAARQRCADMGPTVVGCPRSDRTRSSGSGTPWAAGSPAGCRPGCWPTRPGAPGSCGTCCAPSSRWRRSWRSACSCHRCSLAYRLSAAFGGLLIALIFSMAFMTETIEHRAAKAGYPPGTAARVRAERAERERVERHSPYRRGGAGQLRLRLSRPGTRA